MLSVIINIKSIKFFKSSNIDARLTPLHILSNWFLQLTTYYFYSEKRHPAYGHINTCVCILTHSHYHTFAQSCTYTITFKESYVYIHTHITHILTHTFVNTMYSHTYLPMHTHTCKAHIYILTHIKTYVHTSMHIV